MKESNFTLRISDEAITDINAIVSWYETKINGLGEDFLADLDNSYANILPFPEGFSRYKRGSKIRKKLLSVFPYKIYYLVEGLEIKILAIIHTSRSSRLIKKRLR